MRGTDRLKTALEAIAATHVATLIVATTWAFGGNADWVRVPLSLWGTLGIVLFLCVALLPRLRAVAHPRTLRWIWPIGILNLMVLASCMTPGFRQVSFGPQPLMVPVRLNWWVPSSAHAETSLRAVWLFDALYFSVLNVALLVRRRHSLRLLLAAAVGNALALSVFGTVQKLTGSTGIFFGAVKTPQPMFFASFVYDNHWGAFAILMLGACIGLSLRYALGAARGGFFRGPALAGIVTAVLLGLSIPLSGSRACTFLLMVLCLMAATRGLPIVARALQSSGTSKAGAYGAVVCAAALCAASVWYVAGQVIEARASKTKEQVSDMWAHGGIGSRSTLYRDTWRMARDRPLFGWGMGSFPSVFRIYNTQESKIDRIPVVYHDAHSDWIQSLAEIGFAGTLLVGASALLPLASVRRSRMTPIPLFLVIACILVAAYAWVEFPFGNAAVVLCWWFCLVSGVHYMRLTDDLGSRPPR